MSTTSSSSSRSSLGRPSAQVPAKPLDTLLPYLIASKRSLSTIEHVYRANDICTSTRDAVEKSAIISARTSFVRSGILSQLGVLQRVQKQTQDSSSVAREGYGDVVQGLEEAERRLRETLRGLKETMVEAQLRPEGEERKCLLDFVDEGGVEGLVESIRGDVKEAGKGFDGFKKGIGTFGDKVDEVKAMLESKGSDLDSQSLDVQNTSGNPIPELLTDMEEHAREMAVNLESLVSHFDLCVTAIKHTEGGGDAALKIAGDLPDGVGGTQDRSEVPPEPLSDEERDEMMRVLEEDAGQVEDVVMEIKSHIADMEEMHRQVEIHLEQSAKEHENITSAFKLLEDIGQSLPGYITHNQSCLTRWNGEKNRIDDRLDELDNAKGFYDGFLKAYDNLIIEIGRRKSVEGKIEKVVQEAMSKLEKLHEDDREEREAFKKEQGEFLPVDIWPGLLNAPTRFDIGPVDGVVDQVPDISKSVIHRAIRRVHG